MCLVIKNTRYKDGVIAKWDIPVWKVLIQDGDGTLRTAVRKFWIEGIPSVMVPEEGRPEIGFACGAVHDGCKRYALEGGAIHAYADTPGAIDELRRLWTFPQDELVCVARAVVPKGARYWRGTDNEIAAERLRLVEVVASNRDWGDGLPTIRGWCDGRSF